MRSPNILVIIAFLLASVSGYANLNVYYKNGLWMTRTTITASCPSQSKNQQELRPKLYSNKDLNDAAWKACYKKYKEKKPTQTVTCPKFSNFIKSTVNKMNKLPVVQKFSQSIINRLRRGKVQKYEGHEFTAKNGGELLLWKLKNKKAKDVTDTRVVAEWISCDKVCITLGAIYSMGHDNPTNPTQKNYKKCNEENEPIRQSKAQNSNYFSNLRQRLNPHSSRPSNYQGEQLKYHKLD